MSGVKPAHRWQPAYYPFKHERLGRRILAATELLVKGPVFGCRMCGNCLLQKTAFICPMECPKGMRNGPCGGITPEKKCYISKSRKCVWYEIYRRSLLKGKENNLLEVLPPLDWNKTGTETWGDVVKQIKKTGVKNFFIGSISPGKSIKTKAWDNVFRAVRQPEWWNGDPEYHPPLYVEPVSILEKKLREGKFVVTTEITPPLDSDTAGLISSIESVKQYVTAINFTDSPSARPRMSSIACCSVAVNANAEPVFQIAARDTTRVNLQSETVGLNSFGIKNVLCISGDSAILGSTPVSNMEPYDLDSVQMLWILRKMRDEGIYLDGRKMNVPPKYFLGAATSPFASDPVIQAIKDNKKVNAGAQFLQTNLVFEPSKLDGWLEQLDKRGVLDKVFILIGVAPLKSYKLALYLNSRVPGAVVPETILRRLQKAGKSEKEEGIQIALELINSVKGKKGVSGIHLMTLGSESVVQRIVSESGLINL
jgi:methylenetetrahydrofolate reductase (NADPH)